MSYELWAMGFRPRVFVCRKGAQDAVGVSDGMRSF